MAKLGKALVIILALLMIAGCGDGSTGSGGSGEEVALEEGQTGYFPLDCVQIEYATVSHGVMVRASIYGQVVANGFVSSQQRQWAINATSGNSSLLGLISFSPKTADRPAALFANLNVNCDGSNQQFAGYIAALP